MPTKPLVNEKDDDVPFTPVPAKQIAEEFVKASNSLQTGDGQGNAVSDSDVIKKLTAELEQAEEDRDEIQLELERAHKTNADLLSKKESVDSLNKFSRDCFLAIIQGLAANGDLSLGKLTNDQHTSNVAKHAAGIAAFMAQAAKEARL